MEFVNKDYVLHRFEGVVDGDNVSTRYVTTEIGGMDSFEMVRVKLADRTAEMDGDFKKPRKTVRTLEYRFTNPVIESMRRVADVKQTLFLKTLRAVIGTLDLALTDVFIAKDFRDSFVIRRRNKGIIIQEEKS